MNRLKAIIKVPFALVLILLGLIGLLVVKIYEGFEKLVLKKNSLVRNIIVFSFLLVLLPIWFPIVLVSNVIKFIVK